MKMKKLTITLILILTVFLILTSCAGDEPQTPDDTSTSSIADVTESDISEESVPTVLAVEPLPSANLNGADFNVLIRSEWAYEFKIDEMTGEIVNDAIHKRNGNVEEKYNVNLNFIDIPGAWGSKAAFENAIHNSVLAADKAYDLIGSYQAYLVNNVVMGDFINLNHLPYLDLNQDWWTQKGVEALTLNNRCYMATGDIALTLWENLYAMFFNQKLAEDHGITDMYGIINSGKWTHDKLAELSKLVSADLNGDGVYDASDLYGYASGGDYLRQYIVAYNTPIMTKVSDGKPQISWNTERTVSVVDKLVNLFNGNDYTYINSDKQQILTMFQNEQVFLVNTLLGSAQVLRGMDTDFGIIPYPKFDESQDEYYTSTGNSVTMMCIPLTSNDPETSALIMEAMCREGYELITPAFYEVSLKTKITRDDESVRMIDSIRNSLTFDFGWVYSNVINLGNSYQMFVEENNTDFASYYASREEEYKGNLEKIINTYFGG